MTAESYEVHPDNKGQWLLYQTGDGGFDLVATFAERRMAEFVRNCITAYKAFLNAGVIPEPDVTKP